MKHLAIIADGNRRWARKNGLPIELGYTQGLKIIEKVCEWAIQNGLEFLTFYCFSTENWGRQKSEIDSIFKLAHSYFETNIPWYVNKGIKVKFSGRRDRFDPVLVKKMERAEEATSHGKLLTLVICCDYGGRDEIVRAISQGAKTEEEINKALTALAPCPDVILRTGGNQRLSNFMLWQAAYAELIFVQELFPELANNQLDMILEKYKKQIRNFGT